MDCCPHTEAEHSTATVCNEVTHYPPEDYPCLCEGWAAAEESEVCRKCAHPRELHTARRICAPASGEPCECMTAV